MVSSIVDRILEGGRVEDAFAMQWSPVVDGDELSDQPLKLMAKGTWNQVPLLIGTVQDEGATFIYAGVTTWLPEALHPLIMDAIFFSDGPKVVDFYNPVAAAWRDARDSLSYVLTDYWFKCSSARMAALADAQAASSLQNPLSSRRRRRGRAPSTAEELARVLGERPERPDP